MAIEPYQRKIGIPDAAGGGMTRIADTRSVDIGPAISSLGETLMSTFEPILADQAIKRGNEDAGRVVFTRTKDGRLVLPPPPEDGGLRYAAAYDKLLEMRYVNEVGTEFQMFADKEKADRTTGVNGKKYNAVEYAQAIDAKKQGMLQGIDPRVRPQIEEVLNREGLERTRAFTYEVAGNDRRNMIQGTQKKIDFFLGKMASAEDDGVSMEKLRSEIRAPFDVMLNKMLEIKAVDQGEFEAIHMLADDYTEGAQKYYDGLPLLADLVTYIAGSNDIDEVQVVIDAARGIPTQGSLKGIRQTILAAPEVVTPDILKAFTKEAFGFDANSANRPANHPLSIAARKRGYVSAHDESGPGEGRAIDMPANGKTIEEVAAIFTKAGFKITKMKDEYADPSAIATGGHYHFEFSNKRTVTAETELPAIKDITPEMIMGMDASLRRKLEIVGNERQSRINSDEARRRTEANEAAREARDAANSKAIIDALEFKEANGLTGGSLTPKEKNVYEQQFASVVDVTKLSDPQQRTNAFQFIQQKNYIPESVMNWIDNTVRSPNWSTAAEFYNKLGDASIGPYNARIGDLLLSGLEPKTAALLQKANSLKLAGVSDPAIGAAIESFRSGDAFTLEKAISQFNIGAKKDRGYQTVKRELLGEVFGVKKGWVIPSGLQENFDIAYAANLELTSQPQKSMQLAVKQVTGRYAASTFFQGNIGPSILTNSYPQKTLGNFFFGEKDQDGNQLIKRVKGQIHRFGGDDPSVRLKSAGDDTARIGRYIVYVYEPNNTSNLLDVFEVDLGKEMTDHLGRKNNVAQRRSRADLLSEARARRTKQQETNARQNAFIPMMP
jgi:hypothetical protein